MTELSKWKRLGLLWFWSKVDDFGHAIWRAGRKRMIDAKAAVQRDIEEDLTSKPDRARLWALRRKKEKR